jgi:hypothetical protein
MTEPWRVGRRVPVNVYVGDTIAGQFQTASWARVAVDAVNAQAELESRLADLEAAAQGRFREEWRADVGNPFFEAAKAAADERMAALKHESRSHLMRAEASERQLADMRAALQEIADSDIRYPPHDPGNYMPPKGYDGPCRKIALAALSRASDSIPERS